jgi:predicted lipoprotein with Yx(FWY)xxD motif
MNFARSASVALALALLAAPTLAVAQSAPVQTARIGGHQVLTDARGMTLYTFDEDRAGVSSCYGMCAYAWPPVKAQRGAKPAGQFTVVPRRGGGAMWAYKGAPLYRYFKDRKPGDIKGDGAEGTWHAAVR